MDPLLTTTQIDDIIAEIAEKVPTPSDEECKIFQEEIQQCAVSSFRRCMLISCRALLAAAIKANFRKRAVGAENTTQTAYSADAFRNLVKSAVKTSRDNDAALKALAVLLPPS